MIDKRGPHYLLIAFQHLKDKEWFLKQSRMWTNNIAEDILKTLKSFGERFLMFETSRKWTMMFERNKTLKSSNQKFPSF